MSARPPKPFDTDENETLKLISGLGIDHASVLRFNYGLATMESREFLSHLQLRIPVRELWLGDGAKVGNGIEGTLPHVQLIGAELGFTVKIFYDCRCQYEPNFGQRVDG
jgi:FAD synthase